MLCRLLELDERDRSVMETADAKNALESYIFESRNRMYEDSDVEKVTTEEQRDEFMNALKEAEDWIWDGWFWFGWCCACESLHFVCVYCSVEDETAAIFNSKARELKTVGGPIFMRSDEYALRPSVIDATGKVLGQLYRHIEMLEVNYTWVSSNDTVKLMQQTTRLEEWFNERIVEQETKLLTEEPAFSAREVQRRLQPVMELAKKLLSRPKPYEFDRKKRKSNGMYCCLVHGMCVILLGMDGSHQR